MKITLVFTNGGAAVARFEDSVYTYTHFYDDMEQLAKDYCAVVSDGLDGSELMDWENNQPEMWNDDDLDDHIGCCVYTEDTETETAYTAFTELDPAWGGNVAEFLEALNKISVTV